MCAEHRWGVGGCQVTAEHFQIADPLNNKHSHSFHLHAIRKCNELHWRIRQTLTQTVQPGHSEGRAVDVSTLSHTD